MIKVLSYKRIITIFIVTLVVFFVLGDTSIVNAKVSGEECKEAYDTCLSIYWLPGPTGAVGLAYCSVGYIFCLLYL